MNVSISCLIFLLCPLSLLIFLFMRDSLTFLTDRQNKTSITHRRFKKISDLENSSFFKQQRPYTTSLGRALGKINNTYAYRSLNNAQEQLNQTCGEQSNSYVAQNIKDFTRKYNEKLILSEGFNPNETIKSLEAQNKCSSQPKNFRTMKICGLALLTQGKVQEVLGQPFFINAKEKLTRMLARKKDMQNQYQTIQTKLRQVERQRLISKREHDKSFKNPEPVKSKEWDSEWRLESTKQVARYRTRLSVKHKKTNNITIEW